jgi:2-polyprenyl-6-methoxyphenol hydroxylase-like FAD-dependent oxidoreductase
MNAPQRPGVVLVGDAYSTSCPAAGTGVNKVLTDVHRLCSTYVPAWFGKETIESADVADFYADPVKVQCESDSLQKALWLRRVSTGTSMGLRSWRGARFVTQSAVGRMRRLRHTDAASKGSADLLRGA